ncbi:MAG: DUF2304 domain-containing protein [Peptococcaceae bacterium]|nr:DUF2304 domain-containing protein [Peptococcaceae bacterium]
MVYLYCLLISVVFFFVTLYYLKTRKIEFGFGLIWFGISVFLFVIALRPAFLETIAGLVGIDYKPSFLFACGIFFCLAVSYYLTIKVSEQKKKIIVLTQELSILKNCMAVREKTDGHREELYGIREKTDGHREEPYGIREKTNE